MKNKTKFLKIFFLIALGIFLIASVSAIPIADGEWQNGNNEITITSGENADFNVYFATTTPPMTISAILYDSSNNPVATIPDGALIPVQSISQNYYFNSVPISITPAIYSTTGTFDLVLSAIDRQGRSDLTLTLNVNPVPPTDNLPVITVLGSNPVTIQVGSTYTDAGATATDVEDGDLTSSIAVTNSVNVNLLGVYSVTYSITDSDGNTVTATRTVRVVDTTAPVITINGASTVSIVVGSTYTDAGATATDNYDVSVNVIATNNVNSNVIGTYTVTYAATDSSGNQATPVTRTVNVISAADTTAPVITINGANPVSVLIRTTYVDAGATAIDNVDGVVPVTANTSNVNINVIGTYTVIYTATDSSGNTATATRTVNVVITPIGNAPVISLIGANPVTITKGGTYTEFGATAADVEDGNLTASIIISGSVNTNAVGTYFITYSVTDSAGNAVSAVRTVKVVASSGGDSGAPSVIYSSTDASETHAQGESEITSSPINLSGQKAAAMGVWTALFILTSVLVLGTGAIAFVLIRRR
ncbi:MAG: DUF5011 domain-containing protein [Candidatus Nanoarchaeia archaeon]|nr:DUF5011 domain-containing protein [Candidatus Nanoarchaeia archaeon]